MNFDETASVFQRKAKVSAAGLGEPVDGSFHKILLRETREAFKPFPVGSDKRYMKKHPDRDEEDLVSQTRWLVHGYKETGLFVERRDARYPIAEPVASFGYLLSHTGEAVTEWRYDIEGAGVSKGKDTGGDYYVIPVPKDSFAEIYTRVESIEHGGSLFEFLKDKPLLMLFIILMILYVLWLALRKRSSS